MAAPLNIDRVTPTLEPDAQVVMYQNWHHLLFLHWEIPPSALQPLLPPGLDLDTFEGKAYVGLIPFTLSGVRPILMPPLPGVSNFDEINVRTYVHVKGKDPGVWFFSLDAHNPIAVRLARATFHLPYFDAKMSSEVSGNTVRYRSVRTHRGAPPAEFVARYRPVGGPFESGRGSIENFLTERYCLYSAGRKGVVRRGEVHHRMWPLQPAEAEVQRLAMTEQIGLKLPETDPILHFSRRLDVLAWLPRRIASS